MFLIDVCLFFELLLVAETLFFTGFFFLAYMAAYPPALMVCCTVTSTMQDILSQTVFNYKIQIVPEDNTPEPNMTDSCVLKRVLDRPRITSFFREHAGNDAVLDGALDTLEAHCVAVSRQIANPVQSEQKPTDRTDYIVSVMRDLDARNEERLAQSALHTRGEVASKLLTLMGSVDTAVQNALSKIDADSVAQHVGSVVRDGILSMRNELLGGLNRLDMAHMDSKEVLGILRRGTEDVLTRVEKLHETVVVAQVRQSSNQSVKGKVGENKLLEMLSERLTSRDDYEVDLVCGMAHQCDISIKRLGHPEVRIESKAHGEQSGEKVRARETTRFQNDLIGLKLSGIFVSIHSSIVGKADMAIDMLSTGKFAVYLGNNQYDVCVIESMLHLVYKLEAAIDRSEEGITVTPQAMARVQLLLKTCTDKVNATKIHLQSALTMLTELTFDMISRILFGDEVASSVDHTCGECTKVYKTSGALASHMRLKHPVKI